MAASAIHKIKHKVCGRDANKAQGKAECFISIKAVHWVLFLRITQARSCFNCFKELTDEHLVKAYPFQSITHPSTLFQVRRFCTISYANSSLSRFILYFHKVDHTPHVCSYTLTKNKQLYTRIPGSYAIEDHNKKQCKK